MAPADAQLSSCLPVTASDVLLSFDSPQAVVTPSSSNQLPPPAILKTQGNPTQAATSLLSELGTPALLIDGRQPDDCLPAGVCGT